MRSWPWMVATGVAVSVWAAQLGLVVLGSTAVGSKDLFAPLLLVAACSVASVVAVIPLPAVAVVLARSRRSAAAASVLLLGVLLWSAAAVATAGGLGLLAVIAWSLRGASFYAPSPC